MVRVLTKQIIKCKILSVINELAEYTTTLDFFIKPIPVPAQSEA